MAVSIILRSIGFQAGGFCTSSRYGRPTIFTGPPDVFASTSWMRFWKLMRELFVSGLFVLGVVDHMLGNFNIAVAARSWNMAVIQPQPKGRKTTSINQPSSMFQLFRNPPYGTMYSTLLYSTLLDSTRLD